MMPNVRALEGGFEQRAESDFNLLGGEGQEA